MANTAWTDLPCKGDTIKLHDLSGRDGCKCQKIDCFTPKQFEFEGNGLKNTKEIMFRGSHKAWKSIFKPTKNFLSSLFGLAVGA